MTNLTPLMREALTELLAFAESTQCHHDETHRGGAIWTICNECGMKWADDQGGFMPYSEPHAISNARRALAAQAVEAEPAADDDKCDLTIAYMAGYHKGKGHQVLRPLLREACDMLSLVGCSPESIDKDIAAAESLQIRIESFLATKLTPGPSEAMLYEHDDGRWRVALSPELAYFTRDDPAWHRVGPVELPPGEGRSVEAESAAEPIHTWQGKPVSSEEWKARSTQWLADKNAESNETAEPSYGELLLFMQDVEHGGFENAHEAVDRLRKLYTQSTPAPSTAEATPTQVEPSDVKHPTLDEIADFLNGEAPLDGTWFGDLHPSKKGAFWWRHLVIPRLRVKPEPSEAMRRDAEQKPSA